MTQAGPRAQTWARCWRRCVQDPRRATRTRTSRAENSDNWKEDSMEDVNNCVACGYPLCPVCTDCPYGGCSCSRDLKGFKEGALKFSPPPAGPSDVGKSKS